MATKKQKIIGFGTSIKRFWTKCFTFSGVAQRSEYWFAVLFVFLLLCLLVLSFGFVNTRAWFICFAALILSIFVPFISLTARRVHDIGVSAHWLWLLLIPGAAFAFFLITLPMAIAVSAMYYTPANEIYILRNDRAFWVFLISTMLMFIVFLLPSKLKNNRYRK